MAEVVVNLLVENLTQLLKENIKLISGVKDEVENLLDDLDDFKAFLREAGKSRYENDILKRLINRIRIVVTKAEDLIDKYVVAAKSHYDKKVTRFLDVEYPIRKRELAEEIQKVRVSVNDIRQDPDYARNALREEALPNIGARQNQVPNVEEEHVVGFDGEADAIIQRLVDGLQGFEVISIVGMPGLGKTTLANKVFKDERVEYYFMNRAWIYVSGVYKRRDVFVRILKELTKQSISYSDDVSDGDLALKIKEFLGSAKYLIVLDDVWKVDHWNELKIAFPPNKGSRVLVSTRYNDVATEADSKEINPGRQLETCCRLCVQCNVSEFLSSNPSPSAEHIRSLLCFSSSKYELAAEIQCIRKTFPLLRVLHTAPDESIILTRFPRDMTNLFHLRYIAISTTLKVLPQGIDSLWNMQTLIVRTTQSTLDIKGDIWKLTRLRHVQTNSSAQLPPPSPSKDPFANRNLQTLSRISPESCTAVALAKAPNLNNLGIQGNLAKLFEPNKDTGSSLFKNLGELKLLEKLKLLNHSGNVQRLPQKYEFPQKIKKLTLSNTHLEWTELSILGSLEYLEVLKLTENAFKGEEWEPSKGGFPCLQFLRIERTDLKSWKASSLHFPLLKSLILRQCLSLEEVPPSLADIDNLQEMELNRTNPNAAQSAWKILQIKQVKEKEVKEKGGSPQRFKLNIYPPDELKQIQQI
nr:putative late blight resistance protein homolog R1B-14 [Ipomoea batatas]